MTFAYLGGAAAISYAATLGIPDLYATPVASQLATSEAEPEIVPIESTPEWMSYEPGTGERAAIRFAASAGESVNSEVIAMPGFSAANEASSATGFAARAAAVTLAMGAAGCERADGDAAGANSPGVTDLVLGVIAIYSLGVWVGNFLSKHEIDGQKQEIEELKREIEELRGKSGSDIAFKPIELDMGRLEDHEAAFLSRFMAMECALPFLRTELDDFLSAHQDPSPAFFDALEQYARAYVARDSHLKRDSDASDVASMHAYARQLSTLIGEPRLLANPAIDRTLEKIVLLKPGGLMPPVSFVEWDNDFGDYVLHDDIDFDFAASVERMAQNPRIWHGIFGRRFMSNLSHAVQILSRSDSGRTLMARLALLDGVRYLNRSVDRDRIVDHLVYTMAYRGGRKILEAIADENSDYHEKTRALARRILDTRLGAP